MESFSVRGSSWWERALLNWLSSAVCFCLCPKAGLQHSLGRLWSPLGNSSWPVLLDVFVNLCSSKGRQVVLYSICIVFAGRFTLFVVSFGVQTYSKWKNVHGALIMLGVSCPFSSSPWDEEGPDVRELDAEIQVECFGSQRRSGWIRTGSFWP